jgi:pimeloyl-ACP methyl ester carboxylesterase
LIAACLCAALIGLALAGVAYQTRGERRDRHRFPAPGRLVSVEGCLLHVLEEGTGSPAIVFESGIAASSLSWRPVTPLVKSYAKVVSYDRAGLGWSERCAKPRTLTQITNELGALLERAGIGPPYILVGHSFGGLVIRAFAHRWPERAAGLVFVDPVSIESWTNCSKTDRRRLAFGAKLSRRGAWLARFGVVRFALAAAEWRAGKLTAGIARASAGRATPFLTRLVGEIQKLPPEVMPTVRAHWSGAKGFRAMAEYLEALPRCAASASELTIPQDIPLLVLSAENATEGELRERTEWVQTSAQARHEIVERTGHWMQLERPDVVSAAIHEVVETYRRRTAGTLRA